MKACIYNPYLDTLGGGERYCMAVATSLVKLGYLVDVEWKDVGIKNKLEERFDIDLSDVNIVPNVDRGSGYDVCFWVSDGSIPTLKARNNLLHFQVPFTGVSGKSLINKFKLMRVNRIVCNSVFTKNFIDEEFGVDSYVLYPPVSIEKFKPKKKENIILSVGRFSNLLQSKRQDILIKTFVTFSKSNSGYKLILAGGVEVGADEFVRQLENEAKGLSVEIVKSPSFKRLKELYGVARIFWSASGFGVDEQTRPKAVEHFGITVVEAMSAGCVPIVFNAGGHKEIIRSGENGFLWQNTGELYRFTKEVIHNETRRKEVVKSARIDCQKYSYHEFEKNFAKLL